MRGGEKASVGLAWHVYGMGGVWADSPLIAASGECNEYVYVCVYMWGYMRTHVPVRTCCEAIGSADRYACVD